MRNDTVRDALGSICGAQLHSGDICEAKPADGMPYPICTRHALQVAEAVREIARTRFLADQRPIDQVRRWDEAASLVYYVALPGDRIKIGTTKNLPQRLKALRVDRAAILATEPGGVSLERRRHHQFAALRIGEREDFKDVPMLRDWISHIKTQAA